jgi:prevent-host-death family protein
MTATLEQTQADLLELLRMVQQGEEVVITNQGRPVAKLTGVSQRPASSADRQTWLARLAELRQRIATGKTGLTVEQILDEDRGD